MGPFDFTWPYIHEIQIVLLRISSSALNTTPRLWLVMRLGRLFTVGYQPPRTQMMLKSDPLTFLGRPRNFMSIMTLRTSDVATIRV